jgi:hypothetical protein
MLKMVSVPKTPREWSVKSLNEVQEEANLILMFLKGIIIHVNIG